MYYTEEKENHDPRSRPMDEDHQRRLRYRTLLNKVQKIEQSEDLGTRTTKELSKVIEEANNMQESRSIDTEQRVKQSDETLIDCLVVSSASSVLKKCVQAVDISSTTYEASEFAERLVMELRGNRDRRLREENLLKLLGDARKILHTPQKYAYVYGTYDLNERPPQPKPRRERQPRVVQQNVQKKVPKQVVNMNKDEEGMEEIMTVMCEVLLAKYEENSGKPIGYYDYVVDPEFSTTVENMFYFSFLIRNGKAQIDLDNRGNPIIKPMEEGELAAFRAANGKNTQIISNTDMDWWSRHKKEGYLHQYKKMFG